MIQLILNKAFEFPASLNNTLTVCRMPLKNAAHFYSFHFCPVMKTLTQVLLLPAACLTCVCKSEHIHYFTYQTFHHLTSLIFASGLRSDDEKTFCRALVEYTRACSHVGYPVREWRDSFPSCGKIAVELLLLMEAELAKQ